MTTFADLGIDVPAGRSGNVRAVCPWCSPRRKPGHQREKDLSVDVDRGLYNCQHCGESGSLNGSSNGYGAKPRYALPKPLPTKPLPKSAIAYLAEQRKIPVEILEAAKITFGPAFCPACGKDVDALQIPYFRNGEYVHVKYRHTNAEGEKCFFTSSKTQRPFYGIDELIGAERAAIVEGELDQLTMRAVALMPTVSVPDGSPDPRAKQYATKFDFVVNAESELAGLKQIYIATDSDPPGETMAAELARRLGPERCFRVRWPESCNDANETLVRFGADEVRAAFERATPYPVSGLFRVNDLWHDLESLYEHGRDRGREVGWDGFDQLARARPGLLTIVTGKPGDGKSELVDNWAVKLAEVHDWPIIVCSPENQPLHDHLATISQRVIGKPFEDGPTPRMTLSELRAKRQWLDEHVSFVLPESPSMDEILRLAKIEVYQKGARMLIIDPWTELEHNRPSHMSESEYVGKTLSKLESFALQQQVFAVLVAHPTKLRKVEDKATGKWFYPPPTLYDISGSANFANKADFGISVWRDPAVTNGPTHAIVQKVRFMATGRVGTATFDFDRVTQTYTDQLRISRPPASAEPDPWF